MKLATFECRRQRQDRRRACRRGVACSISPPLRLGTARRSGLRVDAGLIDAGDAGRSNWPRKLFDQRGGEGDLWSLARRREVARARSRAAADARRHVVLRCISVQAPRGAAQARARAEDDMAEAFRAAIEPSRSANCRRSIASSRSTTSPTASAVVGPKTTVSGRATAR